MIKSRLTPAAAHRSITSPSAIASPVEKSSPSPSRQAQERKETLPNKTTGSVSHIELASDGSAPFLYLYKPENGQPQTNFSRAETIVDVHDLRDQQEEFTLQKNGFELHKLHVPDDIHWDNEKEVHERLYPLIEELLIKATGASRVHIFDHTLRKGHVSKPDKDLGIPLDGRRQPVGLAHVDYTASSGIDRLDALLPEEADKLRETPFAVIQVWRPLKGPVESSPLGVIDASTVAKADLVSYPLHFPNRTGYNYAVKYNPDHRWYYAKGIDTNEAYIFTCYDSRKDRARFTPHTGFRDHSVGPDASPRESVELRAYCFWEHEPAQPVDRVL